MNTEQLDPGMWAWHWCYANAVPLSWQRPRTPSTSISREFSCDPAIMETRSIQRKPWRTSRHNQGCVNNKLILLIFVSYLCLPSLSHINTQRPLWNTLHVVLWRTICDIWFCARNTARCIMNPALGYKKISCECACLIFKVQTQDEPWPHSGRLL